MLPIKAKTFVPKVAEESGIREDHVKVIIDTYYNLLRNSLTTLKDNRIHVPNLGTFFAKHWLFDKYIAKYERTASRYRETPQKTYAIREEYNHRIDLINNLKAMGEEELQRKEFVNLHKKTYEQTKENLEEPKADN